MLKNGKKIFLIVGIVMAFIAVVCACRLIQSRQESFNGTRISDADSFLLDFTRMNKEDMYTLNLKSGDTLHVKSDITTGEMKVEIGIDKEASIYRSDNIENGEFDLPITEDGAYTISLNGKNAKGTLHFTVDRER